MFFFNQRREMDVYTLTEDALKQRLSNEVPGNADAMFEMYSKSLRDASPSDIHIANGMARRIVWTPAPLTDRNA